MMKVAITGASGFIGSHLLSRLITEKHQLVVLDFDGHNYPDGIKVVRGNLLNGEGLDNFLDGVDVVIHLAGQVLSGKTSMEEGNIKTTANLISACRSAKIKKFIFASTIAVYGDSNGKMFRETDTCHPDTEYGESKFEAEIMIRKWSKEDGGVATIFRFFSIYGPGNTKGVIYNLCHDFIKSGGVTIYGDGKQKRDLVFVDDVSELIKRSLEGNFDGIYNVGTGKYYSILDLVSILEKISGRKCEIDFQNSDESKVGEVIYSVEKLKSEFGWLPATDIKSGIKKVFEHITQNV